MRLGLAISAVLFSGCASLSGTFDSEKTNKVYIGVRTDIQSIQGGCGGVTPCEGLNPIIDLPLSAVMDTILLPYTLTHATAQRNSKEEEKEPAPQEIGAQPGVASSNIRRAYRERHQVTGYQRKGIRNGSNADNKDRP